MWHSLFIALHAAAGVVAFATGCAALARGALFRVYAWSLAGMAVFLVAAIIAGWDGFGTPARIVFGAFALLAGIMVGQAVAAGRIRPRGTAGPSARYVDRVGFTLVALFDAFAVITVLDLGAPGWSVAAAGIAGAAAGHVTLRAARRWLVRRTPAKQGEPGHPATIS